MKNPMRYWVWNHYTGAMQEIQEVNPGWHKIRCTRHSEHGWADFAGVWSDAMQAARNGRTCPDCAYSHYLYLARDGFAAATQPGVL